MTVRFNLSAAGGMGKLFRPFGKPMSLIKLMIDGHIEPLPPQPEYLAPDRVPADFKPHYDAHIRPLIETFEQRRADALMKLRKRAFIALPLMALVVAGCGYWLSRWAHDVPLALGFMGVMGLAFWSSTPARKYGASVKNEIFPAIFAYYGDNFRFLSECPLKVSSLEISGIIPSYDKATTEDYVEGIYQGVGLRLFEAHLTERRGSGKHRRTVTVFRGVFILFEAHKRFSGQTIVKRDKGGLFNWFESRFNDRDRVKLESPEFEKVFEVYSDDQVEARYLLTPSFMERLVVLSDSMAGKGIQCSFYDNRLLLMIPSAKDRFETSSIYEPATFTGDIEAILGEMSEIFDIVEILKLHERTGL